MSDYTPSIEEVDRWLKQYDRETAAKAEALREAAELLGEPGVLWHGDGGVVVRTNVSDPDSEIPLTQWLRDRADELEGE